MSAKVQIPDALKADLPANRWGKVLTATPVVMTVIATLLAGLSSGEMTRAQYDRSLAAQQQSKAGDQWSYFQAKRLRAALQRNTLDLLRGTTNVRGLDPAALTARLAGTSAQKALAAPGGDAILAALGHGAFPAVGPELTVDPRIATSLAAVEAGKTDAEIAPTLTPVKDADLAAALRAANDRVRAFDAALKPVNQLIDTTEKELLRPASSGPDATASDTTDPLARSFIFARLNYAAQRYDTESRQNQVIAQLYELQVRKSNISAERHYARSQRFFYGMLAAQMAVIISTLSIAARKRNFLWAIAAVAGVVALGFGFYVYVYV